MTIKTTKEFLQQLTPDITGDQIREERTALGLSQKELARILGVSTTTLLRWEAGETSPESPGGVKFAVEYFKLSNTLLNDEVFNSLDDRIEEMQQLREQLERDRAANRAQLDKYRTQLAESEAALPPAPPVA